MKQFFYQLIILLFLLSNNLFSAETVTNNVLPDEFFFDSNYLTINLTEEEKQFLKSLPPLRVPIIEHQAPLSFTQEGQPRGYLNELLSVVANRIGIQVDNIYGLNYKETLDALSQKKVDLLNDYSSFDKQPDYLLQTAPVLTTPFVAVGRAQSESIDSMEDLKNKQLILVRGFQQTKTIQKHFPNYDIQLVDSIDQAYQQLRSIKADYYIDNATHAGYYLTNSMISDLKIAGELPKSSMGELVLRFAVDRNMPLLHSVLDKALSSFSPAKLDSLRRKWLINSKHKEDIFLTKTEQQWLKEHTNIKVVIDPAWAPIEYQNESGEYLGMSIDYLKLLEQKLNVKFEIAKNLSWEQGVNAIKNKQADMFASVAQTSKREKYSIFTKPYISIPIRIFARDDMSYIGNLQNLSGKTIAIARNYAIHDWLKTNHPDLRLVPVDTPADGLIAVSKAKVDVFIGSVVTATYYINKLGLNNVRTAGDTPYANNQSMAVRNDWPILPTILGKALKSITKIEHDEIYNRWMSIRFEHTINYQLVWIISAIALLALMLFFYWNRLLDKQVKKRTKDLAASEEKIRTLYELSPVGIALTDMQGKYLEFNEAFQEICGYAMKELNELDYWELTPIKYKEKELEQFDSLNKTGRYGPYEKEYIQKGGKLIPLRLNGVLINAEDGKSYIWSLVEDITLQKQHQNELHIAKEQAEAANKAKSAFLANMSHEIRTPLNGVLGICQLLQDTPLDKEQKQLLSTMTSSGASLLTIINDILDFSKIESGKIELESRPFNIYELVKSNINLLQANANKKHILLENNIKDRQLNFIGDKTRLSQIIINFLGNAIKFTKKGKVEISVAINKQTEQEANFTISISDTGIGISKEKLEIIFKEFSQADDSITRNFGGTGLGLTISQKLVKLMSGEIAVNSELGKGSTFNISLTLPTSSNIAIQHQRREEQKTQLDNLKILLVEDDRVNQMVAIKMLEKLNCNISIANNGQEAIDISSTHKFDIVFMDIQMPVMDGIKAAELIRKQDATIIIIAMTANVMKEERDKCFDSGMNDFIAKPIQMNKLNDKLMKWTKK